MTCQSATAAARISSSKALTWSGGASGSSAPVQTSTLAFTLPETADGLEIGTAACELQRHRAAETKADCGEPARIDLGQCGERRQRGAATGAEHFRFVAEAADQFAHLLQIARLPAIAEHVRGQRHVTKLGQHPRTRHRELAQST